MQKVITEGMATVLIDTERCKMKKTLGVWNNFGDIYELRKLYSIVGWFGCISYKSVLALTTATSSLSH